MDGRRGEKRGLEVPLIEQATVDISNSFVCFYLGSVFVFFCLLLARSILSIPFSHEGLYL